MCCCVSLLFLLGIRDIQVLVLISFQLCTCVSEFVLAYRSSLYCSLRVMNPEVTGLVCIKTFSEEGLMFSTISTDIITKFCKFLKHLLSFV